MNNDDWQELSILDDIEDVDEVNERGQKRKTKSIERKRKWREIELIKEQHRLKRDLATLEQYSF
jgi:hypothetical protein